MKAADIVRAAQSVERKLITGVSVFDVYEGQGIEPGKKSIAIAVTVQPREKTMTDAEIEALAAKIVAEVGKRTGGVLPGVGWDKTAASVAHDPRRGPKSAPLARCRRGALALRLALGRCLGFRSGLLEAAEPAQHRVGGAFARFPGAADRAP